MPLAADGPTDRAEQMTILTEKLTAAIERETALLRERRPRDLEKAVEEKQRLAAVYAHEMALIKKDRSLIDGAKAEALTKLKEATAHFRTALQAHGRTLQSVKAVTEGMIKAVADGVQQKKAPQTAYGKNAAVRPAGGGAASIALNRVI